MNRKINFFVNQRNNGQVRLINESSRSTNYIWIKSESYWMNNEQIIPFSDYFNMYPNIMSMYVLI